MHEGVIVHETKDYTVRRARKGYEIFRTGVTASTRCAFIGDGNPPRLGLMGAIQECERRQSLACSCKGTKVQTDANGVQTDDVCPECDRDRG